MTDGPVPAEVEYGDAIITGICWGAGADGVLLVHDLQEGASIDSWGLLPDFLASFGYMVLAVDLPGYGGSGMLGAGSERGAVPTVVDWMHAQGCVKIFVIAAGRSAALLPGGALDALALIAPDVSQLSAALFGTTPKLIVAGSADPGDRATIRTFAQQCHGWTLLSTFAAPNKVVPLLRGDYASQIGSQLVAFLHDYRSSNLEQSSGATSTRRR